MLSELNVRRSSTHGVIRTEVFEYFNTLAVNKFNDKNFVTDCLLWISLSDVFIPPFRLKPWRTDTI
jgi:hypothetical protein